MDYNRVQSYIKSHVLPKLDSLPQDVQSVKQAFDAWKADWTTARAAKLDNLDATISSRASSQAVDGVRGGVDTTLQRLTTLEGSVAKLEQGLASVETGLAGVQEGVDKNTIWDLRCKALILSDNVSSGGTRAVLDIKGSGKLCAYYYRLYYTDDIYDVARMTIDDVVYEIALNSTTIQYCCLPLLRPSSVSNGDITVSFSYDRGNDHIEIRMDSFYCFSDSLHEVVERKTSVASSLHPIEFKKNLKIELVLASGNYDSRYANIAYTLDPT